MRTREKASPENEELVYTSHHVGQNFSLCIVQMGLSPTYLSTSHSVNGMANRQSIKSEVDRVTMKMFLGVRMLGLHRMAVRMTRLPRTPTVMKKA